MSAAEKLKALDGSIKPGPWTPLLNGTYANEGMGAFFDEDLYVDYEGGQPRVIVLALASLRNALPQIVAVVEAAEQLPTFFDVYEQVHSFVPLLDALDEALGDVT